MRPCIRNLKYKVWRPCRGGARHFHLGVTLEGPVLQQGELSMLCVGLQCSDMTSRGKFLGGTGGPGKIFVGQCPPGTPQAPPLRPCIDMHSLYNVQEKPSWKTAKHKCGIRLDSLCGSRMKAIQKNKCILNSLAAVTHKNKGNAAGNSKHVVRPWYKVLIWIDRCEGVAGFW